MNLQRQIWDLKGLIPPNLRNGLGEKYGKRRISSPKEYYKEKRRAPKTLQKGGPKNFHKQEEGGGKSPPLKGGGGKRPPLKPLKKLGARLFVGRAKILPIGGAQ